MEDKTKLEMPPRGDVRKINSSNIDSARVERVTKSLSKIKGVMDLNRG